MKKTTLDIIQCFQKCRRAAPNLTALPDGTFEGQVSGYPGLINRSVALKETMEYSIPRWPDFSTDPAFPDTVSVWMWPLDDPQPTDPFISFTVSSPPATGVPVNIALARRPPGNHQLRYSVFVDSVGNTSYSDPQLMIIDLREPYFDHVGPIPAPTPPTGLPTPATLAYFQGLPNETALFGIPDYPDKAPGDYALLYYNDSDDPYLPVPGNPSPKWLIPANLTFPLPLSVVQGSPDGIRGLRYQIYDAADNPSKLSAKFSFDVALLPAPTNFKAPTIDLAVPGDGTLDRHDTAQLDGGIIRIPAYDNPQRGVDGDVIVITLTTSLGSITLADAPLGSAAFPVQVNVRYPTLAALYGATLGLLEMTVSYQIRRRSVLYPSPLTASTDLLLYVVGPSNPDEPSLINPNLKVVVVKGEDATGTEGNDNELTPEHALRPANAYITLWNTSPTPDARPFTIFLYYEGELADTLLVSSGVADDVVKLQIPFELVSKYGNDLKRVFYTIGAAGNANRQYSVDTLVDVSANIISLIAPTIRHLAGSGNGITNCDTFRPPLGNILVYIPPSEYFSLNMIVTVHWRGFRDDAGTDEVTSVAGSKDSVPLTQPMLNNGFELELENYYTRFKPIQPTKADRLAGAAKVHYSIVFGGVTVNSADATPRVRGQLIGGGGTFCDGLLVPGP